MIKPTKIKSPADTSRNIKLNNTAEGVPDFKSMEIPAIAKAMPTATHMETGYGSGSLSLQINLTILGRIRTIMSIDPKTNKTAIQTPHFQWIFELISS